MTSAPSTAAPTMEAPAPREPRGQGPRGLPRRAARATWHSLRRSPTLAVGFSVLAILATAAIFAPVLAPYSPFELSPLEAFEPPSIQHLFGTDELGRDIFSRSLYGARVSLLTGLLATVGAAVAGVTLGLVSGYFGRASDAIIMRAIDIQIAVPGILLAMIIIAMVGRGFFSSAIAVGVVSMPAFARIVRASTLAIKEEEYVLAVKALGAGHSYTMMRTILPNAVGPIIVQMVVTAAVAILLEAALSFLGLGTQPPTPTWGDMLRVGKGYLADAPWYGVLPGVMLTLTVLALDLMGRGLQDLRETSGHGAPEVELEARA